MLKASPTSSIPAEEGEDERPCMEGGRNELGMTRIRWVERAERTEGRSWGRRCGR